MGLNSAFKGLKESYIQEYKVLAEWRLQKLLLFNRNIGLLATSVS